MKRRRVIILLICVSFVLTVIIGIRIHMSIDLDALQSSSDFFKQGLIRYTEDSEIKDSEDDILDNGKKHKQDKKSFFDVVHIAAVKHGHKVKNLAAKKAFDKLSEVGFVSIDDGNSRTKNISFGSKDTQKHERRVRRGDIDVLFGVSPELEVHYQRKSEFRCLKGNQKFPIDFVNDDYCDCDDGSDEPGTSACSNGRFYCKKDKKYILSSRVNDAICDCCDGSDEWKMNKPIGFILPQLPVMRYAPCQDAC